MTAPTPPIDPLLAALADLDRAVEACLRLAWEPAGALPPDERRRQADRLVSAYETADKRADLLLSAIIGAGGCPGLLDATARAARAASERTGAVLALRSALSPDDVPGLRAAERARVLAEFAEARANARDLRVRREVVQPWAEYRAARQHEEATA